MYGHENQQPSRYGRRTRSIHIAGDSEARPCGSGLNHRDPLINDAAPPHKCPNRNMLRLCWIAIWCGLVSTSGLIVMASNNPDALGWLRYSTAPVVSGLLGGAWVHWAAESALESKNLEIRDHV